MLSINWDDVWKMVETIKIPLIVIGVALALAVVVSIAVIRMNRPARKLTRSTVWVAAFVAVVVAVVSMMYGGFRTVLDLASGKGALTDASKAQVEGLGNDISDEGMVLLKNTDGALPLQKGSAVNVWGWGSTNPIYGGTGSGSLSADNPTTSLLDGLANAGFSTNSDLSALYTGYRAERPEVGMFKADWSLPEPTQDMYSDDLLSGVRTFSDTSVVAIARSGGEGFDLPRDVNKEARENPYFSYTDNSTEYTDFQDGQGYLELTRPERDMIALAKQNSEKTIVVVNAANAFQLGELQDDPDIDAIVWAIPGGQVGFNALGRILDGEVNPSAKTPDTFPRIIKAGPAANNFGDFQYTNMTEFAQEDPFNKGTFTQPSFVNYTDSIYVGYRWYETAAAEGVIEYASEVVYPFGHGLSYTSFTQEMSELRESADGVLSAEVTVTNTGQVAGKDVVQVYSNPPYTDGGIEKPAANLIAYEKTKLLQPGESQTVPVTWSRDSLASYDAKDAKAYVLEAGDYRISIRSNSHEILSEQSFPVAETTVYDSAEDTHDGDLVVATNHFDDAAGDVAYLSRAGHFANLAEATAAPTGFEMSAEHKAAFLATSNYDPDSDEAGLSVRRPTTDARNGLVLGDLHGLAYDDPKWDQLLDQLSVDDMNSLISKGGYGSPVRRGRPRLVEQQLHGRGVHRPAVGRVGRGDLQQGAGALLRRRHRHHGARHAGLGLVRARDEHPPLRLRGPQLRVLLGGPAAGRSAGRRGDPGRPGQGRVRLHQALRPQRPGDQPHAHAVDLDERAGPARGVPEALRDRRQAGRGARRDERLQLHRHHLRRRPPGVAQHGATRGMGVPGHGPHRLLRRVRLPERRPDRAQRRRLHARHARHRHREGQHPVRCGAGPDAPRLAQHPLHGGELVDVRERAARGGAQHVGVHHVGGRRSADPGAAGPGGGGPPPLPGARCSRTGVRAAHPRHGRRGRDARRWRRVGDPQRPHWGR